MYRILNNFALKYAGTELRASVSEFYGFLKRYSSWFAVYLINQTENDNKKYLSLLRVCKIFFMR